MKPWLCNGRPELTGLLLSLHTKGHYHKNGAQKVK